MILQILCITLVSLVPISQRTNSSNISLSEQEKKEIIEATKNMTDEQIFWYSNIRTKKRLKFKRVNNLSNNEANCIGYSDLCKTYIDYALKVNGYHNKTYHYVGYLKSGSINWNNVLKKIVPSEYKNFVSNHDFIGMELDDKILLFSPSLYDLIDFGCLTEIEQQEFAFLLFTNLLIF